MNLKKSNPGSLRLSYTKDHRLRWFEIVIDPTASADASLTVCVYCNSQKIIMGIHDDDVYSSFAEDLLI